MTRGQMKTAAGALLAVAALGLGTLAGTPVRAADLGGDCCADLEERVAELEATAVKHGNRKVSLTISGWVNAAVLLWNEDSDYGTGDAYVVNNDTSRSRIDFAGKGNIRDDLAAGYRLQIRPWGDVLSGVDQFEHRIGRDDIAVRNVYVYLDSKRLGKVQLGLQDSAADGAWYSDLGGSSAWIANYNPEGWFGSFGLRDDYGSVTGLLWGDVLLEQSDGQEGRIAYYSPDMSGFSFAGSWGGDDTSAIAAYYSGTHGTVSLAGGIGYDVSHGDDIAHQCFFFGADCAEFAQDHLKKFAVSGSIYESRTGLFGAFTWSKTFADVEYRDDPVTWYLKGGWRKNVTGMGETVLWAEYSKTENGAQDGLQPCPCVLDPNDTQAHIWGLGIAQDIDAVGATAYLGYRHAELENDIITSDYSYIPSQGFDAVLAGMVVQF